MNETGQPVFGDPMVSELFTEQTSPAYTKGMLYYDQPSQALTFFNDNSNIGLQIGQENWVRVYNNSGSSIANGSPVYVSGSSGGLPTIALARANAAATTIGLGLATLTIANNSIGYVTCLGTVNGLDTSALAIGAIYISSDTAGVLTQTIPSTLGTYRYRIGFVTNIHATLGSIHVTPTIAVRITEVTDARTTGTNSATLTSAYPNAQTGDRVLCGNIILGGAIYTKYTSTWLMTSAPTA